MKMPNEHQLVGFLWVYSPIIAIGMLLAVIILMLSACSSVGERAADICTDARLAPGTTAYENCVLRYLPAE